MSNEENKGSILLVLLKCIFVGYSNGNESFTKFVIFNPLKVPWTWIAFYQSSFVISPGCYISWLLYLHYKFRSLTVTDKQQSVSLNIMSVHLSDFADFLNIFIRYRSKQSTSKLSVMATRMVLRPVFFLIKKSFLLNENDNKLSKCFLKTCSPYSF